MDDVAPKVAIIGLGYVGLTLAVALARKGCEVYGIERRGDVVAWTNSGQPHFRESGLSSALEAVVHSGNLRASTTTADVPPCEYYIITVGTPLESGTHQPRLDMISKATGEVADHMPDGAAVILRSTVKIGTTTEIVGPILEASGKTFHLSMCPERTLEGDALRELSTLPQIIGGTTPKAADLAASIFSRLTHTLVRVADPATAEMIKLVDNTSRDVRFAFANEVARACDAVGINANDVIRYGKLGYPRTDVALPGLVGGPCLEKDPHILLSSVAPYGVQLEITAASRLVNERQPAETVGAVLNKLSATARPPYAVVVAGLAFKGIPETDDLRGSMSLHVIDQLRQHRDVSEIRVYDPVVAMEDMTGIEGVTPSASLLSACQGADLLILANNHPDFTAIDIDSVFNALADGGLVYDYWNALGQQPREVLGGRYFTVGNLAGVYQ